jgi:hypothetical protein
MPTDKRDKTIEFEAPSVAQWRDDAEIANAGTQGWNPLAHLEDLLHRNIPGIRPFKIGHCTESDLPTWGSIGWVHLKREQFKVDNFNEAVGFGLGLSDETGVIKFNDNYIMIMPKDYRRRVQDKRNEIFEESLNRIAKKGKGQAVGYDEDEKALAQEVADEFSGLDEKQFRAGG